MFKFLLVIAIIISAIGIYTIGLDDFLKLIQLLAERIFDIIAGWFEEGKENLVD